MSTRLKSVRGTFAADGSSAECNIKSGAVVMVGGSGGSTFGGGTATIQFQGSDSAWYDSQEVFTSANVLRIDTPVPCNIRVTLAGATTPDLDYVIQSDVPDLVE